MGGAFRTTGLYAGSMATGFTLGTGASAGMAVTGLDSCHSWRRQHRGFQTPSANGPAFSENHRDLDGVEELLWIISPYE